MAQNQQNICSIFIFMQRQNKQWLSTINWKFLQKQRWHGSRQWKRNTHWHDRKIYGLHFVIKSISMCESVKYLLVTCSWVCRLPLPQPPTTTTMTIATTTRQLNEKKTENEMKKERPTTASSLIFHSFIRKHNIYLLLTCVIVAAVLFKHSSLMPKVILYWSPFVQFDISFGVL